MKVHVVALALVLLFGGRATAQAVADGSGDTSVEHPAYELGKGPLVGIDGAHNNYHTAQGRYAPFATVLKNDGYRIASLDQPFSPANLKPLQVVVIANALAAENVDNWKLPTPSAVADDELSALRNWVHEGGSLLLVADHMPFAGAAQHLAEAFGFEFANVYAAKGDGSQPELFSQSAGTLLSNKVTRGRTDASRVTEVQTFTGSSFRAPPEAIPIMILDESWTLLEPSEAGKFDARTPRRVATKQDLRAAALVYGKGRVVVAAEAAFITNQLVNGLPYGFGQPSARQNKQFLLNIVEWLSRAS